MTERLVEANIVEPPTGLHEKCAVTAVLDPNAAELAARALIATNHRGRDSTGIGGIDQRGEWQLFREPGAAREIYTEETIGTLKALGMIAVIGHNRYATSGPTNKHLQPAETGVGNKRVLLAMNGNLSLLDPLQRFLRDIGIDPEPYNDTEMATKAFAYYIEQDYSPGDAMAAIFPLLIGAHSTVFCVKDADGNEVLGAVRDQHGIRPLALGRTKDGYMVSSETVGLKAAGAEFIRDVRPGELILITKDGIESRQLAEPEPKFDLFEIVYFSDPNSEFMGVPIWQIREAWGEALAEEYKKALMTDGKTIDMDSLVVGMPSSGLAYARGFAKALGLEFDPNAIEKILQERSFMAAGTEARKIVRDNKYNFVNLWKKLQLWKREHGRKRPIIAVDDSIVRGNTAPKTTKTFRGMGASKISWAIGSDKIMFPNHYGVDTPHQMELIAAAHRGDNEAIRQTIGCDQLVYLPLERTLEVLQKLTGEPPENFETSCFDGKYPVEIGERDITYFEPATVAA